MPPSPATPAPDAPARGPILGCNGRRLPWQRAAAVDVHALAQRMPHTGLPVMHEGAVLAKDTLGNKLGQRGSVYPQLVLLARIGKSNGLFHRLPAAPRPPPAVPPSAPARQRRRPSQLGPPGGRALLGAMSAAETDWGSWVLLKN